MTVSILQQEKLRGRRERVRQRRAEEIAEQREERLARRRETDRASRQLYVLPRRDTHAWIRTELIINAGKHQRLPRRDMYARESLMLSCVVMISSVLIQAFSRLGSM